MENHRGDKQAEPEGEKGCHPLFNKVSLPAWELRPGATAGNRQESPVPLEPYLLIGMEKEQKKYHDIGGFGAL